ncbi:MAG TPA: flavoprotein [Polyangiaceae bacterium]|nr:flavoprotein [Polyangiaceae bacterium]
MDRLLVGVSGSVAVLNLPSYLATLRAELASQVRVIMTRQAARMLPPSTVALICDGVFLDQEPTTVRKPGHLELARWAEMFVILPATANVIGQAANGLGSNLLTTTILAAPEPTVFCPNVHPVMWNKAVVQRNVEILRQDGHIVIEPIVATAYEVDSGEWRESLVLPEPSRLAEQLEKIYQDHGPDASSLGDLLSPPENL